MKKFEEKCSRLPEKKSEEKAKNFAYILRSSHEGTKYKGRNHECKRGVPPRRPPFQEISATPRYQISSIHYEGNTKGEYHDFIRTMSQRSPFAPRYQSLFYGYYFSCSNFGHKAMNYRAYGINFQERNIHVRGINIALYNFECYKCHDYGHIARDYRSMMKSSMKENTHIIYKKVWKRNSEGQNEEDCRLVLYAWRLKAQDRKPKKTSYLEARQHVE